MPADVLAAPVAAAPARRLPWWQQFALLVRLQYTDYRASMAFLLLFSLVMPLGMLWLLRQYVGAGPEAGWLVAGNVVLAVSYGSVTFAISRVGWMRTMGEMDFYGTLPVHKTAFVAALFVLSLVSALPGLLGSLLAGYFLVGIPAGRLMAMIPLSLLAAAGLTVVGAAVGSLGRSVAQVNLYTNLTYIVVTFLSPVLVPVDRLPLPLQVTSYLLPTGQAAMALSEVLAGRCGLRLWLLVGAMLLWLGVAGALGLRKLDWSRD